jgi:hypothetical protein
VKQLTSIVRSCRFCNAAIELNDRSGQMLPYNENGSRHYCIGKEPYKIRNEHIV